MTEAYNSYDVDTLITILAQHLEVEPAATPFLIGEDGTKIIL